MTSPQQREVSLGSRELFLVFRRFLAAFTRHRFVPVVNVRALWSWQKKTSSTNEDKPSTARTSTERGARNRVSTSGAAPTAERQSFFSPRK
jgi:hypothetical protein